MYHGIHCLVNVHHCVTITTIQFQNNLVSPKWSFMPIWGQPPIPRLHCKAQFYFLPLWGCLFWTLHPNGVVQYAVLCIWLLSHEVIWGLVLVLADNSSLLLLIADKYLLHRFTPFYFSSGSWRTFQLFPHYCHYAANISVPSLVEMHVFTSRV